MRSTEMTLVLSREHYCHPWRKMQITVSCKSNSVTVTHTTACVWDVAMGVFSRVHMSMNIHFQLPTLPRFIMSFSYKWLLTLIKCVSLADTSSVCSMRTGGVNMRGSVSTLLQVMVCCLFPIPMLIKGKFKWQLRQKKFLWRLKCPLSFWLYLIMLLRDE